MPEQNRQGTEEEQTRFNLGLALLKRIDETFYILEESLCAGEFVIVRKCLSSIYNEIDFALNDGQRKEINEQEAVINKLMASVPYIDQTLVHSAGERNMIRFRYPAERARLEPLLVKLDRTFRRFMKEAGMLMPPESESSLF